MTDSSSDEDLGYTPIVREVETVRADARSVSSQLVDVLALKGKVSEPGPRVADCDGRDPDTYYEIRHPWTVTGVPVPEMEQAMERLRYRLPERGWEIVRYGPDRSESRSLELIADYDEGVRRFAVSVRLFDERAQESAQGQPAPESKIFVDLISACYEVPEGQRVEGF